ncbi:MAG: tRNA (adenine-N(6)-)-methyltransferase [Bacteroidetes bacterium HGW-Bacteroidetes-1]|nr:MAG: tRNA (adenine-N(6)-)-methyltransferase [Bacteroidetes bacterium HGW-Bacteroidetes-1]
MPDQRPFHFRHFSMMHCNSTMKIGTDSVLLGAWVNVENATKILDIGTGSGILSLMLAQRSNAMNIVGVDIDVLSVNEAKLNFETSQWRKRLKAIHLDIRDENSVLHTYDFIISNPPYFTSPFTTRTERRGLARHTDTLSYSELIHCAALRLDINGIFAVVLPFDQSNNFIEKASQQKLFLKRALQIIPIEGKPPNRINMEFSATNTSNPVVESFIIRTNNGNYTAQYCNMLGEFYLGLT